MNNTLLHFAQNLSDLAAKGDPPANQSASFPHSVLHYPRNLKPTDLGSELYIDGHAETRKTRKFREKKICWLVFEIWRVEDKMFKAPPSKSSHGSPLFALFSARPISDCI